MKQLLTIITVFATFMGVPRQNDSVPYIDIRTEPDSISQSPLPSYLPYGPKATPVDIDEDKPRTVLHYYDKHGEPLDEPVIFLAALDTVRKIKPKPIYPAYNGLNVGINFGDLIFMAFGQRYGSFDLW